MAQEKRTGGNGMKKERVRVGAGRNFSNMRIVKCWKLFPRECVPALSQKAIKMCLDKARSNLVWPCFEQEAGQDTS